jgi:hypothetical protein
MVGFDGEYWIMLQNSPPGFLGLSNLKCSPQDEFEDFVEDSGDGLLEIDFRAPEVLGLLAKRVWMAFRCWETMVSS